ncbi:zinc finger MYND domain-containing protein 15-like protein [Lates japonicus]|uniref:Zinc finger MYND domain-containing protein 15-like protein n=1 Tax=Lates japonicus TaxID=270547 RepID=A0AAD3N8N9_LATJO|nr:zinc finger MYND domain-containing protein 15-like protein [Lates japonicus]
MDQKEVVSGNPHPLQEFTDTMAQWYRSFKTARTEQGGEKRRPRSSYPADTSPYWIVHVIDFSNSESAARGLRKRGITQSELSKRDGTSILMVTDASGLTLGFDILDQGWSSSFNGLTEQELSGTVGTLNKIVLLLQRCMDAPMDGGMPRQPSTLRINVKILHRVLLQDTLKQGNSRWDIALWNWVLRDWNLMDQAVAPDFSPRWPPVYYCNVCKRRSFPTQLRECSQCKAVFYCENKCFPTDSEHQCWCAKLAGYMDNGAKLADLPFSYAAEVTTESFSLEDFLCKNKLVGSYWLHWSILVHSSQPQITHSNAYHSWLEDHSNAYEPLKQEADVLMFGPDPLNPPHLKNPLMSWHQYYEWRGLSLSSVVAPVLSSALSVYYIITSLVPKYLNQTPLCQNGSVSITDSSSVPDEEADKRIIRVTVHRCTYHALQGPVPDLVVGFKPAFLRNDSWISTLPKLQLASQVFQWPSSTLIYKLYEKAFSTMACHYSRISLTTHHL